MISGLEVPLGKALIAGSSRAVGWGVGNIRNRFADRKLRKLLSERPELLYIDTSAELTAEQALEISTFLGTADASQTVFTLATLRMLVHCGNNVAQETLAIRTQFIRELELSCPSLGPISTTVGDKLFTTLQTATAQQMAEIVGADQGRLGPHARAALVKLGTSAANAVIRASALIEKIESLASYRTFENDLRIAIRGVHSTMRIPHAGTARSVPYERLFVTPNLVLKADAPNDAHCEPPSFMSVLASRSRTLILGDPGGGKSTSMLKLTYDIVSGQAGDLSATVPFLVVLRDYGEEWEKSRLPIIDYLDQLCRVPYAVTPPTDGIEYLLLSGRALVIFDGLDELLDTQDRRQVVQAVEGFANRFPLTSMVATSRRVGYEEAPLDDDLFRPVRLGEFDSAQMEAYVRKWFSLEYENDVTSQDKISSAFLADSRYVRDLTSNPLMLSLMCGIYASEKYIPRNRPEVYEKCALLLFDKWDRQRGIGGSISFDAHVKSAMRSLALWLYPRLESQSGLPRGRLVAYMKGYLLEKRFDSEEEAEQAANEFIDFCRGRAWVLTDVGAELYGFTHRTFLEYFAASQLVRQNTNADLLFDALLPHIETAEWDVVCQLSLQILGSTVEDGADDFLARLLEYRDPQGNIPLTVLSFAVRALSFIVPRPDVYRTLVDVVVDEHCSSPQAHQNEPSGSERLIRRESLIGLLQAATPENLSLGSRYLGDAIARRLQADPEDERALVLAWYPAAFGRRFRALRSDTNLEHWRGFEISARQRFPAQLTSQQLKFAWIGAERLREGKLTLKTFIERFGIRGLYSTEMGGDLIIPPIPYQILHRLSMGGVIRPAMLDQVVSVLPSLSLPWIANTDENLDSLLRSDIGYLLHAAMRKQGDDVDLRIVSAAILLAMPIQELAWLTGFERPGRTRRRELVNDFIAMAIGAGPSKSISDKGIAESGIDPVVISFAMRWSRHQVNVIDPALVQRVQAIRSPGRRGPKRR